MSADLMQMRMAIDVYHKKNHAYPHSLQDLIRDGELRAIPLDPITKSGATWRTTVEENVRVDDFTTNAAPAQTGGGIIDVHSGASGKDPSGKPWSDY